MTKNPRLPGNRGFLGNLLFRLEGAFHVARVLSDGAPVGAAHLRAVLAELDVVGVEHCHSDKGE